MKRHAKKDFYRRQTVRDYEHQRLILKTLQNDLSLPTENRFTALTLLSKLKRNASVVKIRNRCVLTGRSRGVYNYLRISRIMIRELAAKGGLPGLKKHS